MYLLSRKLKSKLIFIGLIFSPIINYAQKSFSGELKDSVNGQDISGVIIHPVNSYQSVISDEHGKFILSAEKYDTLTVIISHISFDDKIVTLIAGNTNKFLLVPKSYLTEEVNITATRAGQKSAGTYSVLSKDEIERKNTGQDIPYLLSMTPSTVSTSDAGTGTGYSGLRIRGSDATRINVTVNGIPVNDAESHQVYWVDLPDLASSVENIQIQRGVGASTVGGGAFGGSINILTNKLTDSAYAGIASSAGSFKTFKNTVSFGSGMLANKFNVEGRLSKISSDGYIDRSESDLHSFFLSGGYYGKNNSLRAVIFSGTEKTQQAWYGVPEDLLYKNRTYNIAGEYYDSTGNIYHYENQTDNYQQDNYQLIYSHAFSENINGNLALHYTRGKGYYEEYSVQQSLTEYSLPSFLSGADTISTSDLITRKWLANDFYGITYSLNYGVNKFNFNFGGAANEYNGDHYGQVIAAEVLPLINYPHQYYYDNADKRDISAFLRTTFSANNKLNFILDLQERLVNYSFAGFDEQYLSSHQNIHLRFFNPKAGINYSLNPKSDLYFSVSVAHKEPERDDYVQSSPYSRPKPEALVDYETGFRKNSEKYSFTVNAYYMVYKNQLILTGKINDVGEYNRENVKDSYRAGIEGSINYRYNNFHASANLTLSQNKIKDYNEFRDVYTGNDQVFATYNNTDISFSPSVIGATILGYSVIKNLEISVSGKYVGKQFLDNTTNNHRSIQPYLINDFGINYSMNTNSIKKIEFSFYVNNILDVEYVSNGYTYFEYSGQQRTDYNYYFPQAKRNFMAGIKITLG